MFVNIFKQECKYIDHGNGEINKTQREIPGKILRRFFEG